jgi:hypothetical protein
MICGSQSCCSTDASTVKPTGIAKSTVHPQNLRKLHRRRKGSRTQPLTYVTDAAYSSWDGPDFAASTVVNQTAAPVADVGKPVYVESGTLKVELNSVSSKEMSADAVRIYLVPAAYRFVTDDGGSQFAGDDWNRFDRPTYDRADTTRGQSTQLCQGLRQPHRSHIIL